MDEKMILRRQREIVTLLLNEGVLTEEQLNLAREEIKRTGLSIDRALEKLGFITCEDIVKVQADSFDIPYINLTNYVIDKELIKLIPRAVAEKYNIVPLFKTGNNLSVGMVDPQNIEALDQIRRLTKMDMIQPVLVSEKGVAGVLDAYYGSCGSINEIIRSIDQKKLDENDGFALVDGAEESPMIKLVNAIILQSVNEKASDIHIEPEEEFVRVRFRIDGLLHEVVALPKKLQEAAISCIKILSKLDISEKRKSQDGRIRKRINNKDLDLRVSTFPTVHGENVVLRILDNSSILLGLKDLGFSDDNLETFTKIIQRPNGIILITGPTGSGKSSSLYASLSTINSMDKNIVTIEDPVEYELPLIRQTQINPLAGLTFSNGLRNILRQDPDVIMVGEIRDKETADISIQAALTGHLVFSTLHTNDSVSALTRMMDMGIEPFLISTSVIGIVAQRLVRLICEKCKEVYDPNPEVLRDLDVGEGVSEYYRGGGCDKCRKTGFSGRTGIFEVLVIDEEIRKMVESRESADVIKNKAIEKGMQTLRLDGLEKVKAGLTTPDEVLRVIQAE